MTAGEALDRDNMAGFNCSYAAIEGTGPQLKLLTAEMIEHGFEEPITLQVKNPIIFDEIMYILLCGTGVGFSVERQYIANLPTVGKPLDRSTYRRTNKNFPGVPSHELSRFNKVTNTIRVADSKYGWASALRILIVELYNGNFNVKWNTDEIRPAGSILKTFGGRASGPGPLNELFSFAVDLFRGASGRKLTSIEAHGLVCKIASVVVVGGVRRSALISLSNLSDDRMRHAKSGEWWNTNPEFALANNSFVTEEKPSAETFMREFLALVESKSGERGIFNRAASRIAAGRSGRRDTTYAFGTNPCSEIILRSKQVCNLSEVVVRESDTFEDLKRKVRIAAIIGTLQATLVNFRYLSPEWKKNTQEEALLGVSLTGIMDHPVLSGTTYRTTAFDNWQGLSLSSILEQLKEVAIDTNREWAKKLGINPSTAITAIKPSGTVSQLVDSSSGIHARHSRYYIRTVRNDVKDPLSLAMVAMGVPHEVDAMNPQNLVFSFPIKAPESAVTRSDMTALEQLNLWLVYQQNWCEHKPSVTVSVGEDEWTDVQAWVYKHYDEVSGISFLPRSDHTHRQLPYQECTEEEYSKFLEKMPKEFDWSILKEFESRDMTVGSQELACTGGNCEI
jgi:ribonucleoside-diphosphate reductase alpha chain